MRSPTRSKGQLTIPTVPGRRPSLPSAAYWQLVDARQAPIDVEHRLRAVELIHRITGSASTALLYGTKTYRTIESAGEDVDIARDVHARQAIEVRRPARIAPGDQWELRDGRVYSDGVWRPLTVQGLGFGLIRLLARPPRSFHPGVLELLDFMSDWLAAAMLMDQPPPPYFNPTLLGPMPTEPPPAADRLAGLLLEQGRPTDVPATSIHRHPTHREALQAACDVVLAQSGASDVRIYGFERGGVLRPLMSRRRDLDRPPPALHFDLVPALRRALLTNRTATVRAARVFGSDHATVHPVRGANQSLGLMVVGYDMAAGPPTPDDVARVQGIANVVAAALQPPPPVVPATRSDDTRRQIRLLTTIGESLDPLDVARRLSVELAAITSTDAAIVFLVAQGRAKALAEWVSDGARPRAQLQQRLDAALPQVRMTVRGALGNGGLLTAVDDEPALQTLTTARELVATVATAIDGDSLLVGMVADPHVDPRSLEHLQLAMEHTAPALRNAFRYQRARRDADHDSLTGLPNRRSFSRDLPVALAGSGDVALAIIDADDFKSINDCYGHRTGDLCLIRLVERLRPIMRTYGATAFRIGGEEFAVVQAGRQLDVAPLLSELLLAVAAAPASLPATTVSIGAAQTPPHVRNANELFVAADRALLDAKRQGKNCIRIAAAARR